jgi:hypothetical protein
LVQALGRRRCVLGYHVRYATSADLLLDLAAALADHGAIPLNIQGKSYRAHRAQRPKPPSKETKS